VAEPSGPPWRLARGASLAIAGLEFHGQAGAASLRAVAPAPLVRGSWAKACALGGDEGGARAGERVQDAPARRTGGCDEFLQQGHGLRRRMVACPECAEGSACGIAFS